MKKLTTRAYHPYTNGQVERYYCTIVARLRHYVSKPQRDWDTYDEPLWYAYNNQTHRATGTSPLNVVFLRQAPSAATLPRLTGTASDMPKEAHGESQYTNQRLLE